MSASLEEVVGAAVAAAVQPAVARVAGELLEEVRALRVALEGRELPEVMSREQVCVYLGIKPSTLDEWRRSGVIRDGALMGGLRKWRREWLDEDLASARDKAHYNTFRRVCGEEALRESAASSRARELLAEFQ